MMVHWSKGPHAEEIKEKLRQSAFGRQHSEETKAKLAARQRGEKPAANGETAYPRPIERRSIDELLGRSENVVLTPMQTRRRRRRMAIARRIAALRAAQAADQAAE